MARPERRDADYCPFCAREGRTLFVLESKYGCKGTGFFTNVLRFLTLQEDHHFCINDPSNHLYFFAKTKCDEESGIDMLNIMARLGKINEGLWTRKLVIASNDLLKSLSDAYKKRSNTCISMEEIESLYFVYDILNPENSPGNPENSPGNSTDNQSEGVSSPVKPQRKEKERKGKKEYSLYFEKFFWNHYPNHNGKKSAFLEFKKIPEEIYKTFPEIIKAQVKSKALKKSTGGFVPEWPDPERWLKKARWEDEIEIPTTSTPGPPTEKIPHHCEKCKAKTHLIEKDDSGKYMCPKCFGGTSYAEFTGDPGASIEALIGKAFGDNGDETATETEQDRIRQLQDQASVISGKEEEIDDIPY